MKTIKRGEVWYYAPPSEATGSIQQGARPVVIVSNNVLNETSPVLLAVPCTLQIKRNFPTHVLFIMNHRVSVALTEQVTPVNVSDLTTYKYTLEDFVMAQIDEALKISLGMSEVNTPSKTARMLSNASSNNRKLRWTPERKQALVADVDDNPDNEQIVAARWRISVATLKKYYRDFRKVV